eukprot:5622417-Pyramimonas_sp.AAC.1
MPCERTACCSAPRGGRLGRTRDVDAWGLGRGLRVAPQSGGSEPGGGTRCTRVPDRTLSSATTRPESALPSPSSCRTSEFNASNRSVF